MPHASVNGISLYDEEAGQGGAIVFAHEFSDDCRSFAGQVAHFAPRYRCVVYNARGFAPTEAPMELEAYSQEQSVEDMAGLMRHLGIDAAHVVGISMGSMTTLHFGLRPPEMARSLVICGTGPGDTARAKARFEAEIEDFIADIETKGWPRIAEDYGLTDDRLRLRDKNPAACAGFQERLAMRALNGPLQTLRRTVTGRPLLADLAGPLGKMEVPTLIVTGDEDHVCIDTSLWLKRLLPAAGLSLFPTPAMRSIWRSPSSSIEPSTHSSAWSRPRAGHRLRRPRARPTSATSHRVRVQGHQYFTGLTTAKDEGQRLM